MGGAGQALSFRRDLIPFCGGLRGWYYLLFALFVLLLLFFEVGEMPAHHLMSER